MKNIHLISTDKPSKLQKTKHDNFFLSFRVDLFTDCTSQHIYITSDEEIKEGDYVCALGGFRFVKILNNDRAKTFTDDGIISKQNPSSSCHLSNYKKIILTTDQDLIKDGVQAIDDEFLQWFVKNPSCEYVEVSEDYFKPSNVVYGHNTEHYKIIIPKEEPKQETLEEVAERLQKDKYGIFISKDAEVKGQLVINTARAAFLSGMIEGAKWQEERSYSAEEVIAFIKWMYDYKDENKVEELLKQFKKK